MNNSRTLQSQSRGLDGMTLSERGAIFAGDLTRQSRDGCGGPNIVTVTSNSTLSHPIQTKRVDASIGARDRRQSRAARDRHGLRVPNFDGIIRIYESVLVIVTGVQPLLELLVAAIDFGGNGNFRGRCEKGMLPHLFPVEIVVLEKGVCQELKCTTNEINGVIARCVCPVRGPIEKS